jgi:asparagine synthase (glutamine-hydrolysing)
LCGLVGICTSSRDLAEHAVLDGLNSLIHRGPDDFGTHIHSGKSFVGLGLRRLAIQDLSNSGHQPMTSADGRYVIVFNGEITNFRVLRKHLIDVGINFSSNSDTEVLLNSWIYFGEECLSRLEGMFAFCVLDKHLNQLTLVRDPFGIKPLFYSKDSIGSFLFSSEISSLGDMTNLRKVVNWQRAIDYLQWGLYDESQETFVDGVYQLLPGHLIRINLDSTIDAKQVPYWLPSIKDEEVTFEDASEQVRNLFIESVSRNLIADVPIGIALSGGLDSSSILRTVARLQPDTELYVFSYLASEQELCESKWIEEAIKGLHVNFKSIEIDSSDLARDLDNFVISQGEPVGSTSVYANWRVFKSVREDGIVVTLDGQGADEIFAGYDGYPASVIRSMFRSGHPFRAGHFLHNWSRWPGRSSAVAVRGAIAESSPDWLYKLTGRMTRKSGIPSLNRNLLAEQKIRLDFPRRQLFSDQIKTKSLLKLELLSGLRYRGLPALLRHGDRNSMSSSIESRVPFLDRKLAEYLLSLPEEYLIGKDGETKKVLRSAMKGIVPNAIVNRRDKIGFETPQNLWLNQLIEEHGRHLDTLLRSSGLFVDKHARTNEFWRILRQNNEATWRVINFLKWAEMNDVSINL